jgi:hypothetical protein
VPTNIGLGRFISSGTSLDLVLLCKQMAETNTIIRMAMVIFVIELFMIVPLSKDSEYALFVFKVHTTHLILEQSIVAIIYDDSRPYFDIDKKLFPTDFVVKFGKKTGQDQPGLSAFTIVFPANTVAFRVCKNL